MQGQEMIWSNVALLRSMPHRLELSVIDKTLKNSKHTQNHFLTYKKIQQGVFWKFIEINSKKEIERYFFCNFYEIELFNFVSKINTIFFKIFCWNTSHHSGLSRSKSITPYVTCEPQASSAETCWLLPVPRTSPPTVLRLISFTYHEKLSEVQLLRIQITFSQYTVVKIQTIMSYSESAKSCPIFRRVLLPIPTFSTELIYLESGDFNDLFGFFFHRW